MSTELSFITLDVFTNRRYEGNPLAIVKVPRSANLTQNQKQGIAREFNLSETVFLHENQENGQLYTWSIDIFTTDREVPFAGHPTIGTACFVLSQAAKDIGDKGENIIRGSFKVKAGVIDLQYIASEQVAKAAIPHNIHIHAKTWSQEDLLRFQPGLTLENIASGPKEFPIVSIVNGMTFVLVELPSEEALKAVTPTTFGFTTEDLDKDWEETLIALYYFVRLEDSSDGTRNLRTRMMEGSLEDAATGSAATDLAGYLSLTDGKPGSALKYAIRQGVEMGRPSDIGVEVLMADPKGIDSIRLVGAAVQVTEGRLVV